MNKLDDNKVIIDRLVRYQSLELVHPLTCGVDSSHQLLTVIEKTGGELKLFCEDCSFEQKLPLMFYEDYMDELISNQEYMQELLKGGVN